MTFLFSGILRSGLLQYTYKFKFVMQEKIESLKRRKMLADAMP